MSERVMTTTRPEARLDTAPPQTPTDEEQARFDREFQGIITADHDQPVDQAPTEPPQPPVETIPPTAELPQPGVNTTPELKLVMVDQSKDVNDFALDAADAQLTHELNEGGKFKRFVKGIWKGNLAKDYYRQKYAREARADIISTQDVLFQAESSKDRRDAAIRATIERFGHELGEKLINQNEDNSLEQYKAHESDSELSHTMKSFIRDCVNQGLDDSAIGEQYKRVTQEYRDNHPDDKSLGEGLVQLSNMTEIIKATKGAIEHGESLDNVVEGMKIITGEARTGARSEARRTAADKAVEWMSKRRMTAWIPEGAIAGASSVASFVVRAGSSKTVAALTAPFTLGISLVAPALVGGIREAARVKAEQNQHSREMATGGQEIDAPAAPLTRRQKVLAKIFGNRREQMERTRVNTLSADELITDLREKQRSILLDDSERAAGTTKDGALRAALDALAEAEVYNLTSDNQKKDFISYDGAANRNEQRFQLALARAELKVALENELDDATRARLGFTSEGNVDAILERQATGAIEAIKDDVDKKRDAFKKMRRFRVAKMAGISVLAGVVIGGVAQETVASFTDTNGIVEQAWGEGDDLHDGVNHQTLAERLINGGEQNPGHHGPGEIGSPVPVGERGNISISNDHTIVDNHDGTINFVDPNGKSTVDRLQVNPDGSLPQSSIDTLHAQGMNVRDVSGSKEILDPQPKTVNLDEYIQEHQASTTPVTRDYWYDNNTTRFDKNELRLHWTGSGAVTEGDKTSYHLNISAMTGGGSTHGANSAHWAELAQEGNMKVAISPDGKSQTAPFLVDIHPDGTINVTPDHPAAKFFTVKDGKTVFTGRYLEVVETRDVDANGKLHISPLSTLVGTGEAGRGTFEIPSYTEQVQPAYEITTGGYDTPASFVEVPPIIPIVSRKSLENLRDTEKRYGYGYEARGSAARAERERSPRLRRNPDARLNPKQELDWYKRQIRDTTPAGYVQDVEQAVVSSPELAKLKPELKAIVTIPVGAAGEADNIYKTLSLYAQQDPAALQSTTLLLHVNWIDSAMNDPAKAAAINKTKAEIDRARQDFPGLTIATMESVWSQEKIDRGEYGNGLIGHVAGKMYDVAMMSVQEGIANGVIPPSRDVLLIRNDADAQGMDRRYLGSMIKASEEHPENDVFTGAIRWDTKRHEDLPGFAFVSNFREVMQITGHRKGIDEWPQTVGINTAVRMSTFAAVGGIGHDPQDTGAGSDDLSIGARISGAREGRYGNGTRYGRSRLRRVRGQLAGSPGYNQPTGQTGEKYTYHRHVVAAGIDSKGDRLESAYLSDRTITGTWENFDRKGHTNRSAGLAGLTRKESFSDPGTIINHIEANLSSMFTNWYGNPAQIRSGLSIMLPQDIGGKSVYTIKETNGKKEFKFSSEGAKWVIDHLQRKNGKGPIDPIGSRVRRQLYQENPQGFKLNKPQAQFVQ